MRGDDIMNLSRTASTVILATYAIAFGCVIGMLTNWFRYVPSLEATFVFAAMIMSSLLVIAVHLIGRRMKSAPNAAALLVSAVVLSAGLTSYAVREAYGTLTKPTLNHVEKNAEQTVQIGTRTLLYHLELVNPYSAGTTILVIREGRAEQRVNIPLFKRGVAAFVVADEPGDWARLYPTNNPNIAELLTSSYLREARFQINLSTGVAKEVR